MHAATAEQVKDLEEPGAYRFSRRRYTRRVDERSRFHTPRLGCQARFADEDLVVEITDESLQAWLDENPEARKKAAGG